TCRDPAKSPHSHASEDSGSVRLDNCASAGIDTCLSAPSAILLILRDFLIYVSRPCCRTESGTNPSRTANSPNSLVFCSSFGKPVLATAEISRKRFFDAYYWPNMGRCLLIYQRTFVHFLSG